MVWDYDCQEEEEYVDEILEIFREKNAQICLVELQAGLGIRLKRNRHEHRLKHKPSKRDVDWSEQYLHYSASNFRMESREKEFEDKEIYKIDNSNLQSEKVARMIREKFKLEGFLILKRTQSL